MIKYEELLLLCSCWTSLVRAEFDGPTGILMTGGWNGVNQFFNPFTDDQVRIVDLGIKPMWGPSSATYRSRVYVIGGRDDDGVSGDVQIYDPNFERAFPGLKMNVPRRWHSSTTIGLMVYVCGGADADGKALASCEGYNVTEHEWLNLTDMPRGARYAHASVAVDDKLYIIGGWDGKHFLNDILEYNPSTEQWRTSRAPMLQPRMAAAAVAWHEHIVVCGGWMHKQRLATCEIYSPFMNRWTYGPLLSLPRSSHAMAVFNDAIFVMAGEDDEYHMLDTIEHYDIRNNASKLLAARLRTPMRDFTAVPVGETAFRRRYLRSQ